MGMEHLDPDVRHALATEMTIDITTTGRQSGEPRRIEIWFLHVDGRIYITGTPGRRDWMANMRADPRFVFHLKASTVADLAATAIEVTEPAERRSVFEHGSASWYRNQTPLDHLIDAAPMVRVEFDR